MSGTDRVIDPLTKDYVDDGHGEFVTTTSIATAIYHQIQGQLNRWVGDPNAGSLLFLLPKKSSETNLRRAKDMVESCLAPFIKLGLAAELVVEVDRDSRGVMVLRSSMRDAQHAVLDLSPLLPFGA